MRFKVSTLVAAAALIAAPVAGVSAQSFASSGCTGNVFLFCASWNGIVDATGKILTLSVTNTSANANSVFTQIWIGNLPVPSAAPVSITDLGAGTWAPDGSNLGGLIGQGMTPDGFGAAAVNGINDGIHVGQIAIIRFDWTGTTFNANTAFDASVRLGLHDQGTPASLVGVAGCNSSKGVMSGTNPPGTNFTTLGTTCGGGGGFSVPEPSTYALMTAGLAALGFVARRRRQNV